MGRPIIGFFLLLVLIFVAIAAWATWKALANFVRDAKR